MRLKQPFVPSVDIDKAWTVPTARELPAPSCRCAQWGAAASSGARTSALTGELAQKLRQCLPDAEAAEKEGRAPVA